MDETKGPGIAFDAVMVTDLTFKRTANFEDSDQPLDVEFGQKNAVNADGTKVQVTLSANVANGDRSMTVACSVVGQFSVIPGEENMSLQSFIETNAPAMLFPFIREVIATISMKSGMATLLLPPMNVVAMIKNATKEPASE